MGIKIGKFFSRLFGGVGKALKGEKDKLDWISPEKLIAKPSEQETTLLKNLFPYAKTSLTRASDVGQKAYGFLGPLENNLLSISQGVLPSPYKKAVNRVFNEQLGGTLNNLANRGVINSSVGQRAISNALNRAMDMQVNYLPIAAKMSTLPYSTFRDIEKDYLVYPSNLWNTMMTARHGVRAMPIVQKGKPGLLGVIGSVGGAVLGGSVGGPMGAMLGSQLGGYLGNTTSQYL